MGQLARNLQLGKNIYNGAVDDLKIFSSQNQNIHYLPQVNLFGNARKVPTLIYTSYSTFIAGEDWKPIKLIYYNQEQFFNLPSVNIHSPLELAQSLYSSPDQFDPIVPVTSQAAGMSGTLYQNILHTEAQKNNALIQDLIAKLGQNPLSAPYNNNGFQPAPLTLPSWFNSSLVIQYRNASDSIKISNPSNNSTYDIGDTINFHISRLSGNVNYIGCDLTNQGQTVFSIDAVDSVINFQYTVPSNVYGTIRVLAYGLNGSGTVDYDSIFFSVNINATLDSMNFQTDSLFIPLGTNQNINVNGYYSDSTTNDISTLSGMVYTIIDTNIVSLSSINTLLAKQIGTTQLIASYLALTDTMHVTVYQGPNHNYAIFTTSNNVVCGSGNIQFTDQSGGTPMAWSWQFPGGTPSFSTAQNPLVSYSTLGSHDVTLITTWSDKVDTLNLPMYIIVNSLPSATITPSGSISLCQGRSIQLTANYGVGYSYLWTNGTTSQSITVSDSGNFSVTVIDSLGCNASSITQNIVLFENPIPIVNASGATTLCSGDSVTLSSSITGTNYLWSTGATTQIISANTTGNYLVTVTDSIGCTGTSVATIVTVNPLPTVDAGNHIPITLGTSTVIGGSPTATGNAPFNFSWTPTIGLDSSNVANPTATPPGTIIYTVFVTDVNGCSSIDSIMVDIITSLIEVTSGTVLFVFPSPTNDMLNITGSKIENGEYWVELKNVIGQTMISDKLIVLNHSIQKQFSISNLTNGMYFLIIDNGKIRTVTKVQKMD